MEIIVSLGIAVMAGLLLTIACLIGSIAGSLKNISRSLKLLYGIERDKQIERKGDIKSGSELC